MVIYSYAQKRVSVKGMVADSLTKAPIINATIQMNIDGTHFFSVTEKNGYFKISIIKSQGKASIWISNIGYKTISRNIDLVNENSFLPDTFYLMKEINQLKEVTVKTIRILNVEPDKIIYSAKSDMTNRGLTGFEIIQKAPLIDISSDNKLYVSGKANFRILINGKISGVANQNPVAYLRNLPAKILDKIEIITDPPLKYRQEGVEKLINIITDKSLSPGFYMALNGSADSRKGFDAGYFLLYHSRRFSLGSNLNVGNTKGVWSDYYYESSFSDRFSVQKGKIRNISNSITPSIESTYEIDSLKLLSFSAYGYFNRLNSNSETLNHYQKDSQFTTNNRSTYNKRDNSFYYAGLDYEQIVKNSNRQTFFTLSSKLLHTISNYKTEITQDENGLSSFFINQSNGNGNEITNQLDFVTPYRKAVINIGYKNIVRFFNSTDQIQDYNLKQNLSIPYFDIKYILKKNIFFKIGSNIETVNLNYYNTQKTLDISKSFFNMNPRIGLYTSLKGNKSYSLIYSRSALRPGIRYLSPVVIVLSPDVVQIGNPDLGQELFHTISFNYNTSLFKKILTLAFYTKFSNNNIVEVRRPYNDSILAINFSNRGKYFSMGNSFYYAALIGKNFSFRLNTDVAYQKMGNEGIQRDALYYKLFITIAYKLPENFSVTLQNFIYSKTITYQGYSSGYPDMFLTIGKKILKNKLNTALILYQPFISFFSQKQAFDDFYIHQFSQTTFPARYIGVKVNYDFGNIAKAFGGRKKQKGITNNDLKD